MYRWLPQMGEMTRRGLLIQGSGRGYPSRFGQQNRHP
jgi:hypothetical protein